MRSTIALIHKKNLQKNIQNIKTLVYSNTKICVPVKANAYGHGLIEISKLLLEYGVDVLAVATISEASILRSAKITAPILLLSLPQKDEITDILETNVQPLVFTQDFIIALNKTSQDHKKNISVHLAIDTGMGRIGCKPEDAGTLAELITKQSNLTLAGCCTHFAVSDSLIPDDIAFTKKQIEFFKLAINSIKNKEINPGLCHCAATGGTLMYPEAQFDMVRPGLISYGYFPSAEIKNKVKELHKDFDLYPVMELQSKITSIKTIEFDTSVSYGRIWASNKKTNIATIPIGYGDGLKRCLSPGLKVCIQGKRYPIVGRICMDQCMIDIGNEKNIHIGDIVTIFSDKTENQRLEEQAILANTITYEILTGIMPRVPRIYLN